MNIIISNADSRPIYEQIQSQFINLILSGNLEPDEMLPSIRNLAKDLRISVITTKRAYEELERAGYIYTVAGKGSFVAEQNTDMIRETKLREIEELFAEIGTRAAVCKLSREDLIDIMDSIITEGDQL